MLGDLSVMSLLKLDRGYFSFSRIATSAASQLAIDLRRSTRDGEDRPAGLALPDQNHVATPPQTPKGGRGHGTFQFKEPGDEGFSVTPGKTYAGSLNNTLSCSIFTFSEPNHDNNTEPPPRVAPPGTTDLPPPNMTEEQAPGGNRPGPQCGSENGQCYDGNLRIYTFDPPQDHHRAVSPPDSLDWQAGNELEPENMPTTKISKLLVGDVVLTCHRDGSGMWIAERAVVEQVLCKSNINQKLSIPVRRMSHDIATRF